jgi:hypothetical protein
MYVNANFYKGTARVTGAIRYISHREESLPEGTTRPLYGLGPRYRELQGDEAALARLLKRDARRGKVPTWTDALARAAAARVLGRPSRDLLRAEAYARSLTRGPGRIASQLGRSLFNTVAPRPLRAAFDLARVVGRLWN